MKYKVHQSVTSNDVAKFLPSRFRQRVPPTLLIGATYTLVVFRSTIKVVRSADVKHALKEVREESHPVIVVGVGFTADSLRLLGASGVQVLSLDEFYWTDESHEAIRVLVGASVKAPQHR